MLELNSFIFDVLRSFSGIPFIGVLADLPIFFIPLFLSGLWLQNTFWNTKDDQRLQLLHIFYACVVGVIFSYIIKQFVDIERPESYLEQTTHLIMNTIPQKSFPSDHATVSFAFAASLLFTSFTKTGYIFLIFAILMNISRIIVGVHWPLDILAGSLTGILAASVFFIYLKEVKLVKNVNALIINIMTKIKLY